jgi:hypothetical protein
MSLHQQSSEGPVYGISKKQFTLKSICKYLQLEKMYKYSVILSPLLFYSFLFYYFQFYSVLFYFIMFYYILFYSILLVGFGRACAPVRCAHPSF